MESAERVYLALQHAGIRLRELDDEIGLSAARFSVLAQLRYGGATSLGELARAERVSQPTMTQLVDALEHAGLARRAPDANDRRRCIVELTPEGRALVRRARARKIAWVKSAIGGLAESELVALDAAAAIIDDAALRALASAERT